MPETIKVIYHVCKYLSQTALKGLRYFVCWNLRLSTHCHSHQWQEVYSEVNVEVLQRPQDCGFSSKMCFNEIQPKCLKLQIKFSWATAVAKWDCANTTIKVIMQAAAVNETCVKQAEKSFLVPSLSLRTNLPSTLHVHEHCVKYLREKYKKRSSFISSFGYLKKSVSC